jgi:hypothetical protein
VVSGCTSLGAVADVRGHRALHLQLEGVAVKAVGAPQASLNDRCLWCSGAADTMCRPSLLRERSDERR